MKILMITHLVPYPPINGASLRNFNLIRENSRFNEIHLLTFYQKAHLKYSDSLDENIDIMKKFCTRVEVFPIPADGNRLRWVTLMAGNIFSLSPYSSWLYHSSDMICQVKKNLRENQYDIIEIGEIGLLKYAKLAPDIPKVLVHHNVESELLFRRGRYAKNPLTKFYINLQARKLRIFEKKAGKLIKEHTVCSHEDKKLMRFLCPDANITVVPNGVDTDYFSPDFDKERNNTLVFVGGMGWLPNKDAMFYFKENIWPLIKREIPDVKIRIIGPNPDPKLTEYGKRDPDFILEGLVPDIRPYVHKSAVYVVPIRIGGGTRLKILDAMAMGKAIVSTTIGAEGIEVEDGKQIRIVDEPEVFAKEVCRLLKDPAARNKMGRRARRIAEEKYSWKVVIPLLMEVYKRSKKG